MSRTDLILFLFCATSLSVPARAEIDVPGSKRTDATRGFGLEWNGDYRVEVIGWNRDEDGLALRVFVITPSPEDLGFVCEGYRDRKGVPFAGGLAVVVLVGGAVDVFPIQDQAERPEDCTLLHVARARLDKVKKVLLKHGVGKQAGAYLRVDGFPVTLKTTPIPTKLLYEGDFKPYEDLDQVAGVTLLGAHRVTLQTSSQSHTWSFRVDDWHMRRISAGLSSVVVSPTGMRLLAFEFVRREPPMSDSTTEIRLLGAWMWSNNSWQRWSLSGNGNND
jgi:hypothetical protein